MISENEALQLLKKYLNNDKVVRHCLCVADIAGEIATKIKQKNSFLVINPEKVRIAALLHDIGKYKEGFHELNTIEVLSKEGLDDIA